MTTPAPNASPTAVPPVSTATSPPSPSSSPSTPSNNSSLPSQPIPNQTSDAPPPTSSFTPSNSSSPPPQSPLPADASAPPPSPPMSSPPPVPLPTYSSPPLPPPSPPTLPSPSSSASPSPTKNVPSPPNLASPPPSNLVPSPPPDVASPLPRANAPPQESPVPSVVTPPPSVAVPPSPPPPANVPSPPSVNAQPPGPQMRTGSSPPPPSLVPHSPTAPPSTRTPSGSYSSPPPSVPSSSLAPPISPASPSNSSANRNPPNSSLPSIPTTPISNITGNASPRGAGGLNTGGTVAIALVLSFLALSLVVMAVWYIKRGKRREARFNSGNIMLSPFASSQKSDSSFLRPQHASQLAESYSGNNFMFSPEHHGFGNSKSWFTYEELAEGTNKFSVDNLLGEGGFGCVYKGILPDGREIAVKQLKIGGEQGEREFRAEVEIISRVHHRHLVSLVGYCISEHQRLLVYDYVPNNTLHYHLHGEDRPVMDWATRIKVAAGAARGIAYLHEDCDPRIIHRDIKSSNILLDNNFEARVADFGLAKLALDAYTHVTTRVMGTFGYLAPEYASTGKLTEKSDVFSFGVVLLELITGRKPVDTSQPLGDEGLVGWARPLLTQALDSENFEELVDPRLENNFVENEMFRMVEAAAACVRHSASKRPRMSQVVRALDSIAELSDITNGMKPGQSEVFNSREQSAQIRMFQRILAGSQDYSSDLLSHSQGGWRVRDSTPIIYQQR